MMFQTTRTKAQRALFLCLFAILLAAATGKGVAAQEPQSLKGVALVIGQSKYEHIDALPNPANDAREIVKLLTDMGFDARSVSDRDAGRLKRDLERFVEDAEGADVAFLYYSGHGIEAGGENWLVPVDADVSSLANAGESLVGLSTVMDELKATVPVAIILLDACRTNPFPADAVVRKQPKASGEKIGAGGLVALRGAKALATAPAATDSLGTVIGFAAEPGRPALDGQTGANSPYATALLRHLAAMQGIEFGSVMRMVTEEVYLETRGAQRPWVNESLRRLLYFGVAPDQPGGDEARITGERLKKMFAERDALRADDPEIVRLASAADTAIRQGAIVTARQFLDDAVARVEATSSAVDAAEEAVKQKRLADASVYVQRADASSLAFDYLAAAADYGKAYDLVVKWDDRLAWNYKNLEAEALNSHGYASGDRAALDRSIKAYEELLGMVPYGQRNRDWAITRNNMAVVLQTIGERAAQTTELEQAAAIFRESLAIFAAEKDDLNFGRPEQHRQHAPQAR